MARISRSSAEPYLRANAVFYRDTLDCVIEEEAEGMHLPIRSDRLWIDRVPNLSHPDIGWSSKQTTPKRRGVFENYGIARRDEVEQLREDFDGFGFPIRRRDSPGRGRRRIRDRALLDVDDRRKVSFHGVVNDRAFSARV